MTNSGGLRRAHRIILHVRFTGWVPRARPRTDLPQSRAHRLGQRRVEPHRDLKTAPSERTPRRLRADRLPSQTDVVIAGTSAKRKRPAGFAVLRRGGEPLAHSEEPGAVDAVGDVSHVERGITCKPVTERERPVSRHAEVASTRSARQCPPPSRLERHHRVNEIPHERRPSRKHPVPLRRGDLRELTPESLRERVRHPAPTLRRQMDHGSSETREVLDDLEERTRVLRYRHSHPCSRLLRQVTEIARHVVVRSATVGITPVGVLFLSPAVQTHKERDTETSELRCGRSIEERPVGRHVRAQPHPAFPRAALRVLDDRADELARQQRLASEEHERHLFLSESLMEKQVNRPTCHGL